MACTLSEHHEGLVKMTLLQECHFQSTFQSIISHVSLWNSLTKHVLNAWFWGACGWHWNKANGHRTVCSSSSLPRGCQLCKPWQEVTSLFHNFLALVSPWGFMMCSLWHQVWASDYKIIKRTYGTCEYRCLRFEAKRVRWGHGSASACLLSF